MTFDEEELSKGQIAKLNTLRKSVGDDLADVVFAKWLKRQKSGRHMDRRDPVADKLAKALSRLTKDTSFRLGNKGYTVRRARGRGAAGFIAERNKA